MLSNSTQLNDTFPVYDIDNEGELMIATLVPIFFGLIAITGFIGNVLVVLVVFLNPSMRSTTNLLIINLAIADLLFIVFCIPFTAVDYLTTPWFFGDTWCKIVQYMICVTVHASIYTLVLMSVDRFLAVVYAMEIQSIAFRTEHHTYIALSVLWTCISIVAIPVLFIHGEVHYVHRDNLHTSCSFMEESGLSWATFYTIFFVTSYLLPLVLISYLYVRMLIRLWATNVQGRLSSGSQRGKKRVTRMIIIVVSAFAILWFPIQIILVLKSLGWLSIDTHLRVSIQIGAQILAYTSSCINPLLYSFLSESFKKAFRKVIVCPLRRGRTPLGAIQLSTKTSQSDI